MDLDMEKGGLMMERKKQQGMHTTGPGKALPPRSQGTDLPFLSLESRPLPKSPSPFSPLLSGANTSLLCLTQGLTVTS